METKYFVTGENILVLKESKNERSPISKMKYCVVLLPELYSNNIFHIRTNGQLGSVKAFTSLPQDSIHLNGYQMLSNCDF